MTRARDETDAGGRAPAGRGARARILDAAYDLFSQQGVRAVSIDEVVARSGVARMTLYRHFASKEDLVMAFLERRDEQWTRLWLQAEVEARASTPSDRLLAIFDVFDTWFRRRDFEGCAFINVMLEHAQPGDPVRRATVSYLAGIRNFIEGLARQAGIARADNIAAAAEGDVDAARRAQEVARAYLELHLPARAG
jgi:AcrR family transcriptional regulator